MCRSQGVCANSQLTLQVDHLMKANQGCGRGPLFGLIVIDLFELSGLVVADQAACSRQITTKIVGTVDFIEKGLVGAPKWEQYPTRAARSIRLRGRRQWPANYCPAKKIAMAGFQKWSILSRRLLPTSAWSGLNINPGSVTWQNRCPKPDSFKRSLKSMRIS